MSFTLQPGTLSAKVVPHFIKHPDDELDSADIAAKFGATGAQVDALLSSAVAAGVLNRRKGRGASLPVFMAGPRIEVAAVGGAAPAAPSRPADAKRKYERRSPPDAAAIVIHTGVPMPPALNNGANRPSAYAHILGRMKAGDMVELNTRQAKALIACAKKLKVKASIRSVDAERARVWRLA